MRSTNALPVQQEQWKAMLENDHKSYIPMRNIVRLQSIFDKNHIQVIDGIANDILTERVSDTLTPVISD